MNNLYTLLTLVRSPLLGAFTFQRLFREFGSAEAIWQAPVEVLQPLLGRQTLAALEAARAGDDPALQQAVSQEMEWLDAHPEVVPVALGSAAYPALLAATDGAPPLLYVCGNTHALELPQLAVVGSRNPTAGGRDNAFQFSHYLAANGFAITSGLALGIDATAHRGALDAGGATLAVMGTGIDQIYPTRNRPLAESIVEGGGALVSEFAPGTTPTAGNFPRRNRVISGLSLGTLVVEAAVQSGSLITARTALEQQREVFAIPGSIHNPLARGAHRLIRQGAHLVETAADIVQELGGTLAFKQAQVAGGELSTLHEPDQQCLLDAMGYDPVTLDALCERSGLAIGKVSAALTDLELSGAINRRGAIYSRGSAPQDDSG